MNHILFLVSLLAVTSLSFGQVTVPEAVTDPVDSQSSEDGSDLAKELEEVKSEIAQFEEKIQSGRVLPQLALPPLLTDDAALSELTARLAEVNASLAASRTREQQATDALETSAERITVLSELIAETRAQLAEMGGPLEGEGPVGAAPGEPRELIVPLLEARIERYQKEQAFLQQELEVLPERIRQRKDHHAQLLERKEELQKRIASLRRQEAQKTNLLLSESYQKLSAIPELAALVREVKELNEKRTGEEGLQAEIRAAVAYEREVNRMNQRIRDQKDNAEEKIELLESVGLEIDTDTGILLREQRAELPSTGALQRTLQEKIEQEVRSRVALIDLQDKRAEHPPLKADAVRSLVSQYPDLAPETVEELFEQRRKLLESLVIEHQSLTTTLNGANIKARETITLINAYSTYLDKRLLWSRSTEAFQLSEPQGELENIRQLFSGEMLRRAWGSVRENWLNRFIPALVILAAFLFGIFRRRRLREIERQGSEQAAKRNCTSIRPTVETVVSSALIAFTFPALFFLLAVLISDPMAYQTGCLNAGIFLFVSSLVYRFSRSGTLFESHFKFSSIKARRIRTTLRVFIPIMLPFVFGVGALCVDGGEGSSGRVVFLMTMAIVTALAHRLFHPKHSVVGNPEKATVLSRVSYLLAMLLPISFAIGAALGFFSSVLTLRAQVLATAGVLLGAFLVIRFFTRWILVSRRRLAINQALQRREATLAHREREESGEVESETSLPSLEEVKAQAVDVVEVEEQTSQLVRFGVYFSVFLAIFSIWSSSLTALSVLDRYPLWPGSQNQAATPSGPSAQGSGASGSLSSLVPGTSGLSADTPASDELEVINELVAPPGNDFVSWQDLLLSLFVFLITFVAARNIPGLLSLAVFSRLNLGPGGNFAFTTVVRYFIVLTGVVIALNKVGITWDKVQWLAAAITLGIGFGLQEIFANFVAGLILLFERPLRLGDIVTVGDISGKVTEIKIRATTIQQFNNRDLVVPNKDFITNQLTNWTLRDSILRFELPVGIAYGSDTRKAEGILKKIIADHPNILQEPAPAVIFNAFGASTLDFLIRAHVGQVGNLVQTQHELHFLIDDAFREAGIEIAFPQQDIHLRSLPEGMVLK